MPELLAALHLRRALLNALTRRGPRLIFLGLDLFVFLLHLAPARQIHLCDVEKETLFDVAVDRRHGNRGLECPPLQHCISKDSGRAALPLRDCCLNVVCQLVIFSDLQVRPFLPQIALVSRLRNVRAVRRHHFPRLPVQPLILPALQLPVDGGNVDAQLLRDLWRLQAPALPLLNAQPVVLGQMLKCSSSGLHRKASSLAHPRRAVSAFLFRSVAFCLIMIPTKPALCNSIFSAYAHKKSPGCYIYEYSSRG